VTLSAFAAGVLASGSISLKSIFPLTAIFLLACGASALNQVQEKDQDAKMNRTKNRPLPASHISVHQAILVAALLFLAGFGILILGLYAVCVILGVINILWYNGFYTWLKKKTAFAVVPGALSGVIPVFMGWSAAGGSLTDRSALLLALFLFIWQIPHFWLLMLKYEDEYRAAGFPVMTDTFSAPQFRNIIMAWMSCATATSLMLVYSGIWIHYIPILIILTANLLILVLYFSQLYFVRKPRYNILFITMNFFLTLVLSLIILEKTFL
jgi:protoheme IX farnesyltransferase